MKRRFMMWMTIVCILVVGVSVTRMTREFIGAQGMEAAAIVNVMDAGSRENAMSVVTEETAPEMAAGGSEETVEDIEYAAEGAAEDLAVNSVAEAAPAENSLAEAPEAFTAASPKAPIDTTKNEAIQETVKSPLDPAIVKETVIEAKEESVSCRAEDFFERFAQAEQNALQLWENVTPDNRSAYLAAAEQERALWDYELNHVYQVIRERLSQEEMEELKVQEMEWIKERDLYAEKAIAKSSMKNAQNQNPDYTRALAEKTKERCYWLVSEYEELLNQD